MNRRSNLFCCVILLLCGLIGCASDKDPDPAPVDSALDWDQGNWDEQEWQ